MNIEKTQAALMWKIRKVPHAEKGVIIAGMLAAWLAPMPREAHAEGIKVIIDTAISFVPGYQQIIKKNYPDAAL